MIDSTKITKYNRTDYELEEFLLFCTAVAGKTAKIIEQKLEDFIITSKNYVKNDSLTPFQLIEKLESMGNLLPLLKKVKMGNYGKLHILWRNLSVAKLDLKTVTIDYLESLKGIGPKTSRYFILHSRANAKVACLDTHILKWLRDQGFDAPERTPSKANIKLYKTLENIFIAEANSRNMSIADLDLKIWNEYSKRSGSNYKK